MSDMQNGLEKVSPSTTDMNKEQRLVRRRALNNLGITSFNQFLSQPMENKPTHESGRVNVLVRKQPKVLQLNIGLYCNQACKYFFETIHNLSIPPIYT
jgi:hypothetical protein